MVARRHDLDAAALLGLCRTADCVHEARCTTFDWGLGLRCALRGAVCRRGDDWWGSGQGRMNGAAAAVVSGVAIWDDATCRPRKTRRCASQGIRNHRVTPRRGEKGNGAEDGRGEYDARCARERTRTCAPTRTQSHADYVTLRYPRVKKSYLHF